jgi:methylation protein EvaC
MSKIQFLDLGKQPLANGFLTAEELSLDEFMYDLRVGFDPESGLVTLMDYVSAPLMFNENYAYHGSMSNTMVGHFNAFANRLQTERVAQSNDVFMSRRKLDKILEIGSNDGVFLKNWETDRAIGVEPCKNFADLTNDLGYKTYDEFWTKELAAKILRDKGTMDLVFAANCICHIPDLDETFSAVHDVLSDDGIFVFEDPSLFQMINRNSYDQLYDEHAHVFSCHALKNILRRNGLYLNKVEHLSVHGGSNRIWASKDPYTDISVARNLQMETIAGLTSLETFTRWAEQIYQSKKDLVQWVRNFKREGRRVISYGATSKSTTVFNFCELGPNDIDLIVDTTPSKIGKYAPGTHIPIVSRSECNLSANDAVFLGAWNFSQEIMLKEKKFIDDGGMFFTHVPKVMVL